MKTESILQGIRETYLPAEQKSGFVLALSSFLLPFLQSFQILLQSLFSTAPKWTIILKIAIDGLRIDL